VSTYVGIDPQVLEVVTGGNAALADKIVQRYLSVAGGEIGQLSELITAGDRVALKRQAHRVLGAAAMVGAIAVEEAARRLEEAIAEGSDEALLPSLIRQVDAAFGALAAL
jgi:HPt (histidine-containing phosphotransfer) domain-containing protein